MRKEYAQIKTVADLLEYIKDLNPETPIVRMTNGYNKVDKQDVYAFVDELVVHIPGEKETNKVTALRIYG